MSIEKFFTNFPTEEQMMNIIMHTSSTVRNNELTEKDIENWLNNFRGEVYDIKYERLLALWLLAHFTYYNQNEVRHLCKVLYRDLLHLIVSEIDKSSDSIEVKINKFFTKANIITPEMASGSGGFIAYFFRQENDLPIKSLFNFSLDNISNDIENIIVIDDVTLTKGSAGQMYNFWDSATNKYPAKKFFLLTLISSESSYDFLKKRFLIEIVSAVKLDDRDKCFHNESDVFSPFKDLLPICKTFATHYGQKIGVTEPLGFSDGQYTFGFFYNTPDNTLPIFWGQKNNWIPILKRYHKNYKKQKYFHDERFI